MVHAGSDSDLEFWLALNRAPGLGSAGAGRLLEQFGCPRRIFAAKGGALARAGVTNDMLQAIKSPDWRGVERDLRWLSEENHHLIRRGAANYPPQLAEIPTPPIVLFVAGDASVLRRPQVAVVGSRKPTHGGREVAARLTAALVECGLVVTSGLALGVDGCAHAAALAAGGLTVAVAGAGVDRIYPRRHRELAEKITGNGALISEFAIGTAPLPAHFPQRNRIISGLGLGVIVVEAAKRSGSLTTARHAAEQGREVFAVPGSVHNPMARGCHHLIRQGAKLVEEVGDVMEELPAACLSFSARDASPHGDALDGVGATRDALSADAWAVYTACELEAAGVDTLVERTALTADTVSSMLLDLELKGYVASAAGGLYARARKRK